MLQRAISGLVFISVLISCVLYNQYSFMGLFFILMTVAIYEYQKLAKTFNPVLYLIGSVSFLATVNKLHLSNIEFSQKYFDLALYFIFFITFLFSLFDNKKFDPFKRLGKIFLGYIYAVVPFTLITTIPFVNSSETYAGTTILGVLILIWSTDTFAYLTGRAIGKHKLLERISPKKTIEGFAGGVIATIGVSYIISIYFTQYTTTIWIFIGVIVSVFGMLGDLIESMFKRHAKIKDSGNLIPGHGGVLDRFDSLIYTAPFIYIFLQIII